MKETKDYLLRLSNKYLKEEKQKAVFFKFKLENKEENMIKEFCLLCLKDTSLGIVFAWSGAHQGCDSLPATYHLDKHSYSLHDIGKSLDDKIIEHGKFVPCFPEPYEFIALKSLTYKYIADGPRNKIVVL